MKPSELFGYFEGKWNITRNITSLKPEENMNIKGIAEFSYQPKNILKYYEECEVLFNDTNNSLASSKVYYYEYDSGKDICTKYFEDYRMFYELNMKENLITGVHLCGNDIYNSSYQILSDDKFSISYDVKGPQKKYLIETIYSSVQNG